MAVQVNTIQPSVKPMLVGNARNSDAVDVTQDGPVMPERMLARRGKMGLPTLRPRRDTWMTDLFAPAVKLTMTALFGARAVSVRPVKAKLWSGKTEAAQLALGVSIQIRRARRTFM